MPCASAVYNEAYAAPSVTQMPATSWRITARTRCNQRDRGYTRRSARKRSLIAVDVGMEPSSWPHPRASAGRLVERARRA
eukprot:3642659-Pleurochrysis_carterae.AAC.1